MSDISSMPFDFMPDEIRVTARHRAPNGDVLEVSAFLVDRDGYPESAEFRRKFDHLRNAIWTAANDKGRPVPPHGSGPGGPAWQPE